METLHPGRAGNNCVSCATCKKMMVSIFTGTSFIQLLKGFFISFYVFVEMKGVAWRGSLFSLEGIRAKRERQQKGCCLSPNYSSVGECGSCPPFIPFEGLFPPTVRDTLLLNQ